MQSQNQRDPVYVLGHSESEIERLVDQSRFFGALTEQVLINAGIERGMRILDLGCGPGDVSFLLARMVGPSGHVIGLDKSAEAIAAARARAEAAKLENVTFVEGEVSEASLKHPIDAAVGRFVLMYISEPADALRQIARHVKPGGLIAFQEMDLTGIRTLPRLSFFEQCVDWVVETLLRVGVDTQMGLKLRPAFIDAGLPAPEMIMGARVEGGPDSPGYEVLARFVQTLLPTMQKLGVTDAADVQIETLASRIRDEAVASGGVIVFPNLVGAWARKPV